VPVDRGLPYAFPLAGEKAGRLIHRNVPAPQGLKIIQNTLPLAGSVIRRTAMFHDGTVSEPLMIVNMKMNVIFILGVKTRALPKPRGFETAPAIIFLVFHFILTKI
jgi:hypothetical protein